MREERRPRANSRLASNTPGWVGTGSSPVPILLRVAEESGSRLGRVPADFSEKEEGGVSGWMQAWSFRAHGLPLPS